MIEKYIRNLAQCVLGTVVTDRSGDRIDLDEAIRSAGIEMQNVHDSGGRVMFIGNGGSAGVCSHMAVDYSKNGGIRATALNDPSVLTCISNDYGYEFVFSKQIEWHARRGDILVAISSSGQSANILNAVEVARDRGCKSYTLSGFSDQNPLRRLGDVNFFMSKSEYGFVEVGHLALLHGILDLHMGLDTVGKFA